MMPSGFNHGIDRSITIDTSQEAQIPYNLLKWPVVNRIWTPQTAKRIESNFTNSAVSKDFSM